MRAELREYPIWTEFELIDAEGLGETSVQLGAVKGSIWTWGAKSDAEYVTLNLCNKQGRYVSFYPYRFVVRSKEPKPTRPSGQTI